MTHSTTAARIVGEQPSQFPAGNATVGDVQRRRAVRRSCESKAIVAHSRIDVGPTPAPPKAIRLVSDEELAAQVARRDTDTHRDMGQTAYSELYSRHSRRLLAFLASRVGRSDLDDVSQEIWQRVWVRLPDQFHGGNFRAWLHQIARNLLIDRSRKRKTDTLDDDLPLTDPNAPSPDAAMLDTERTVVLNDCLQRLGDKLEALVRARLTGDEYDDICDRFSINPNQVYKLYHQAKSQLTTCVERSLP